MEDRFFNKVLSLLGRDVDAEEEALLRDLVARIDGELDIATFWKLLDWLAAVGMKAQAEGFIDRLAALVASRITLPQGPWPKALADYSQFQAVKRLPNKQWMKWSLKQSQPYYELCTGLSMLVLESVPVIAVLGGEMSGDMFGIGAAMVLKPSLITVIKQTPDNPFDHTRQIESFLLASLNDRERVIVHQRAKDITWAEIGGKGYATLFAKVRPPVVLPKSKVSDEFLLLPTLAQIMRARGSICWVTSLDTGSKFLKERTLWEVDRPRIKIRRRWGVISHDFAHRASQLETWLTARHLPVAALRKAHKQGRDKKVLILWSRFTGKKGEIHPEHDTSFKGVRQIVTKVIDEQIVDYVIIAGDKPVPHDRQKLKLNQTLVEAQQARRDKYVTFCEEINLRCGRRCVFDLTEFWTDKASENWTGGTRIGQFLLYEYLHRVCDARHLGMRSGNLEAMALLGYWVRYMEEVASWGGDRMEQWHERALGYVRILLSAPPTRTGKYLVEKNPKGVVHQPPKEISWILSRQGLSDANDDKPDVIDRGGDITRRAPGGGMETVSVPRFEKGFDAGDVYEIVKQLRMRNFRKRIDTALPD